MFSTLAKSLLKTKMLSPLAKSLVEYYDEIPMVEILELEQIMIENKEKDPMCQLVDDITNWVYEDTELLMPVSEAYRLVKLGILNE